MIAKPMAVIVVMFIALIAAPAPTDSKPAYEVYAIRYASSPDFPVSALVAGADKQRKLEIAMTVWLIKGNGRNVLVDSGFYRPQFFKDWKVNGFLKPSEAVAQVTTEIRAKGSAAPVRDHRSIDPKLPASALKSK